APVRRPGGGRAVVVHGAVGGHRGRSDTAGGDEDRVRRRRRCGAGRGGRCCLTLAGRRRGVAVALGVGGVVGSVAGTVLALINDQHESTLMRRSWSLPM